MTRIEDYRKYRTMEQYVGRAKFRPMSPPARIGLISVDSVQYTFLLPDLLLVRYKQRYFVCNLLYI